ncbi:monomethylamine:corrinoid methyltransferase, partial [Candidatus Bipolaricaulota bacterium]|nr:monomethylamine:corrinoid methyltransferase [Candidatus Bipolaricaulota bacterium]
SGRPGSAQYAYEFSALALTAVTSGSNVSGPRPAEPLGNNHVSPLMGKLFAEVAHAAAGMTRKTATPIVEALYDKYKDKLDLENAPKGQPFEELYNLKTLTPTPEHQALYDQVKAELVELGIPLV